MPDPDDILTNNILNHCYKYANKYNIKMIRFNLYIGKGKIFQNDKIKNIKTKLITQTELSNYIFYGNLELDSIDTSITNKFIKKQFLLKY